MTTTTPKRLDGFSRNFQGILVLFWNKMVHFISNVFKFWMSFQLKIWYRLFLQRRKVKGRLHVVEHWTMNMYHVTLKLCTSSTSYIRKIEGCKAFYYHLTFFGYWLKFIYYTWNNTHPPLNILKIYVVWLQYDIKHAKTLQKSSIVRHGL